MAVTTVTTTMAGAINYTVVTDTSADWASVANSTYFYDKADKLVHYKDSTGVVQEIFSAAGGGGITVGTTTVTSGTNGRVFFQAGGAVQQSANLFWDNTNSRLNIGGVTTNTARLDVRAPGALTTDIAFRVRNSADSANLVFINGVGDITLGSGSSITTGAGGNGTVIAIGENAAVNSGFSGYPIAIGRNSVSTGNAIAIGNGASNGTGQTTSANIAIGLNATNLNTTANCVAIGSSVSTGQTASTLAIGGSINFSGYLGRNSVAVGYNFTGGNFIDHAYAFGSASSAATLDIGSSFSIYINRTTRSFFVNQNSNLVFRTNATLTSGTHFDANATNTFTLHSGTAPASNIVDAAQQYVADVRAGNAAPHFRTENGSIIRLYQETAAHTVQDIADGLANQGLLASSLIMIPSDTEVFRGRTFRYDSTTADTVGGLATLNNASSSAVAPNTTLFANRFTRLRYFASIVTTGRVTSIRSTDLQWYLSGGFRYVTTFRVSDTAFGSTCQNFFGLIGTTAEIVVGGASLIQVSTLTNCIFVGNDGADANLQVMHNDGTTGNCTKIDLGASFPANRTAGAEMSTMYSIELYNKVNTTSVIYKVINLETSAVATGTITTNLPDVTQGLAIQAARVMGTPTTGTGQFELHKWGCSDIII